MTPYGACQLVVMFKNTFKNHNVKNIDASKKTGKSLSSIFKIPDGLSVFLHLICVTIGQEKRKL